MNPYLKHLNRIEFEVTMACSGQCMHCSEGDHAGRGEHIDSEAAVDAVRKICEDFKIESLMTFGGEPLLYPEVTFAIQAVGKEIGIPKRQVITNGFFSKDLTRIEQVAKGLAQSGVNDLLLSVDAFHQETIPLEPVKAFALAAKENCVPVRISPAWLVSETDDNHYNRKTREVLGEFTDLGIPVRRGNVIFPSGNALIYLKEYFTENAPENPYEEDPDDVWTVSIAPNGDVDLLGGNIYRTDIREILRDYKPRKS